MALCKMEGKALLTVDTYNTVLGDFGLMTVKITAGKTCF